MASVSITGQIDFEYTSNLDLDTVCQEIQDVMEKGNQAAIIYDFSAAVSRYKRAWRIIQTVFHTMKMKRFLRVEDSWDRTSIEPIFKSCQL